MDLGQLPNPQHLHYVQTVTCLLMVLYNLIQIKKLPYTEKPKPKNEKQKKQPKPKSIIVQGIWIGSRDIAGLLCPD